MGMFKVLCVAAAGVVLSGCSLVVTSDPALPELPSSSPSVSSSAGSPGDGAQVYSGVSFVSPGSPWVRSDVGVDWSTEGGSRMDVAVFETVVSSPSDRRVACLALVSSVATWASTESFSEDMFTSSETPLGMVADSKKSVSDCVSEFGEFDFNGFEEAVSGRLFVGYFQAGGLADTCTFSESGYGCNGFSDPDAKKWFVGFAVPTGAE